LIFPDSIGKVDRDRNLILRTGLFPRGGGHHMRTGKVEIVRQRRIAADHLAEADDEVLLAAAKATNPAAHSGRCVWPSARRLRFM
jgi:hypothetical protein